jgi:hypothetical protein
MNRLTCPDAFEPPPEEAGEIASATDLPAEILYPISEYVDGGRHIFRHICSIDRQFYEWVKLSAGRYPSPMEQQLRVCEGRKRLLPVK